MKTMIVVEYDSAWPRIFDELCSVIAKALGDTAIAIEHVGSTSVPGLSAKPIIDIDVIVAGPIGVNDAIAKLEAAGYKHRGDLGITDREAFDSPHELPRHNLYVCKSGSLALRNHLAVRDVLRTNVELATEYGALKVALASRCLNDSEKYCRGKTDFLIRLLESHGSISAEDIDSIKKANQID